MELTKATREYLTKKSIFFGFRFCNRFKKNYLKKKLKDYFKRWKREADQFSLKKEEQKKIEEAVGGEYRVVIVNEENGTEDMRFSTLK